MGRLTNKEEIFPSIYIEATRDNTERITPREAGSICGVGYMNIGNPLHALNIVSVSEKLKSIKTINGGNPKNETLYHLKDYFNEYRGRVYLARLLGADSTVDTLKVFDNSGTLDLGTSETIDIFGATGMESWGDTATSEAMEILIKLCPQGKIIVDIVNVSGIITITLQDEFGNRLYRVKGNASMSHLDDYGESDYIGNIADDRIIGIKVDTSHASYNTDFSVTKEFTNGITTDAGLISEERTEAILNSIAGKSDYVVSFGQTDSDLLKMMKRVSDKATIGYIVDIKAPTMAEAISKKDTLGFSDDMVYWIWNRVDYKFKAGVQNVGISGFIAGRSVARNIHRKLKRAEYRISGIAGIYHPVPRVTPYDIELLSETDKTTLTKERINTIQDIDGKVCISDVLSGLMKETDLMSFPVADGVGYIKRTLGLYLDSQMFKNIQVAKSFMENEARIFFEHCQANAFFDDDAPKPWRFDVYDEDNDTVVIDFVVIMEGVMRKGVVRSTITR